MRYTLDTEFIEFPCTIDLLSIGLVAEDGREFYAVSDECDRRKANPWVVANVFPKLGTGPIITRKRIAAGVREFIGDDKPEFWGYYADYDWVAFCWLFGAMVDLPHGWPMYCNDIKQLMVSQGVASSALPPIDPTQDHNALYDAKWEMAVLKMLSQQKAAVAR